MGKQILFTEEINKIKNLRATGHTLFEIKSITKRANGTIWKYIEDVAVLPEYQDVWKSKRGGSKAKSDHNWKEAQTKASNLIKEIDSLGRMLVLSCLYWGEGNKKELNLINSDPSMVRVVLVCLKDLGIENSDLKISLRLFEDIDKEEAILFWTKTLSLPHGIIQKIDVIPGKKVGKLKYGMCRVRVKKGGKHFKLIMSMIDLIRLSIK